MIRDSARECVSNLKEEAVEKRLQRAQAEETLLPINKMKKILPERSFGTYSTG